MKKEITPLIIYENPNGPLIRQAKVCVTRRLSNIIMVRAGLYTYEKCSGLEIFLICEAHQNGSWQQVGSCSCEKCDTDTLEYYYPFSCEPNRFHRVLAFYMVNNRACREQPTQRLLLNAMGVWNNWGRDDGLDEPKSVPLSEFYDGLKLPGNRQALSNASTLWN